MSFGVRSVVLGPGEGRIVPVPGMVHQEKAEAADTGGAYALMEVAVTGTGPPQHIHHAEEEALYVVDGEVNVLVGDKTVSAPRHSFVLVPRGTIHTYWNAGTAAATLLVIVSPPGFEQMFAEVVGGDDDLAPETFVERVVAVAPKYHLEVVGPPLG
jgi:mannose-6-phosphate isomerase-like protein (cupin superfamily)